MNNSNLYKFVACSGLVATVTTMAPRAYSNDFKGDSAKLPNIVVFIADDLGLGDVKCYDKTSTIPTPAMDRLAQEGMLFSHVHSPAAVCTPTRFSVLTGLYPFRSYLKKPVLYSSYEPPLLKDSMLSLPEMLKDKGYATGGFGKWHVGCAFTNKAGDGIAEPGVNTSEYTTTDVDFSKPVIDGPMNHGFDYWFGLGSSINHGPYTYIENDRVADMPTKIRPQVKTPGGYFREGWIAPSWDDDRIDEGVLKKARSWIRAKAKDDKPFFMYFAELAPHFPHVPQVDLLGTPIRGKGGTDEGRLRADFVLQVDTVLAKLLERLDDPNGDGDLSDSIADNTLVIVTSDNGADKGYYAPIRGKKGDIWEGGHRVPFIVRWPGEIKPGTQNVSTFGLNDLYATFAAIAGSKHTTTDSIDVRKAFSGSVVERSEPLLIQKKGGNNTFAVIDGKWKFIYQVTSKGRRKGTVKAQLYNLDKDPKETTDSAANNPEVLKCLSSFLKNKLATR